MDLAKALESKEAQSESFQIEDDAKRIDFSLEGDLQVHGAHGKHDFRGVLIDNNGIFSYNSSCADSTHS